MTSLETWRAAGELVLLFVATATISAAFVLLTRPILVRFALAPPNARSSHRSPTPQGGGVAVIGSTIIAAVGAFVIVPDLSSEPLRLAIVLASTIGLAVIGATDDIRPLEALPRLFLQAAAILVVLAALPNELRIVPILPWWIERLLMLVGFLWFVNLVNFMDGIDWMTVAEIAPLTAALTIFGLMGALPAEATLVALALCGAIIGFSPFNRPPARLFLGDVGSLPIGLLLGWLLVLLAGRGHLAAALLLPLYYLADATVTLLRRLIAGDQILQAHRSHYYQRAMDRGFSVYQIVGRVFGINVVLVGLAATTFLIKSPALDIATLVAGIALVGILLWNFSCSRPQ